MYNELFKWYPAYENIDDKCILNLIINMNLVKLLEKSVLICCDEPDYNNRHLKQNIVSFDTGLVTFSDGFRVYDLLISIANLKNKKSIVYAKKYLKLNNNIKIKEIPRSKSSLTSLCGNNITQSNINVKLL